jgi:hypothetical protein
LTLLAPSDAVGLMVMFAVADVALFTVSEFTVMPGPKLAVLMP